MDTQPSPADDLSELERRLSDWRPSTAGLDTAGMLFAAGRNSARPGRRIAWPVVAGCLALLASALAVGLTQERAARIELTARVNQQKPMLLPAERPQAETTSSSEAPALESYLAAHSALRQDLDPWPAATADTRPLGPPPPAPHIWTVGQHDDVLKQ
jgi:hypothetical protein